MPLRADDTPLLLMPPLLDAITPAMLSDTPRR
jgi:hypothetical protein